MRRMRDTAHCTVSPSGMLSAEHAVYDAAELWANNPLAWQYPNKILVASLGAPPGSVPSGTVRVARWKAKTPSRVARLRPEQIRVHEGPFAYDDPPSDSKI